MAPVGHRWRPKWQSFFSIGETAAPLCGADDTYRGLTGVAEGSSMLKKRRRNFEVLVNASDVIILEGILVFHDPRVRNLMNMKIFVDTDADVRLARRIKRDTVERGRDYAKFVKPAFDDFVLPSKKYADVIIPRGGDNHVAIDLIVQHIRTKLGQHNLCKIYPNVHVIQSTFQICVGDIFSAVTLRERTLQIRGMHTLIRDKDIATNDFVFYSDRLIRLVVEHGLGHLPFTEKQVMTPTERALSSSDVKELFVLNLLLLMSNLVAVHEDLRQCRVYRL
ncbi:Uridine kinase-like protein 1 [Nymphaea thermarum]|nr:Uridine kinase-like protein 1 [Nymphaea thermarum]